MADSVHEPTRLEKVEVEDLALHADARGWLMELCHGPGIAYVYATMCYPGVVKGWHRHARHTDRLACVQGAARIVTATGQKALWDGTPNGRWDVEEHVCGPAAPNLVKIPPGVWHAFTPAGPEPCVIVNCPDEPWDPGDEERLALDAIPWNWREVSR